MFIRPISGLGGRKVTAFVTLLILACSNMPLMADVDTDDIIEDARGNVLADKILEHADQVKAEVNHLYDDASDAIQRGKERVRRAVVETDVFGDPKPIRRVKAAAGDARDRVGELAGDAVEYASDAVNKVKETAESVKERVGDTANKAKETAGSAKSRVEDEAARIKRGADIVGEAVKGKAAELYKDAADVAGNTGERVVNTAEQVKGRLNDAKQYAKGNIESAYEATKDNIGAAANSANAVYKSGKGDAETTAYEFVKEIVFNAYDKTMEVASGIKNKVFGQDPQKTEL